MSQTFLEIVMRHLDNSLLLLMLQKFPGGFLNFREFGSHGYIFCLGNSTPCFELHGKSKKQTVAGVVPNSSFVKVRVS